jgi:signal transduction histidine kinase
MMLWYIQIMNNLGITNSTFILHNNIFLSIIIETGVYLYFIIDRFVSERKEKITLLESKLALQKQITTSVVEAQENERKRVAQELHDGLGGYLSSLRLLVNRNKTENKTQNELLQTIEEKLDHAIHDVREISHNLMPTDFASKDFTTILKEHLTILNDNGNIRFEFFFDEKLNSIEKSIQISLYRITSELIRNIQTHSGATVATIQLIAHANQIVLNAEDNGVGFNSNNQHSGIGLKNTQSRVDFLHGKLNIDSNKLGTTIIIEIPINYETAQTHFN